MFVCFPCTKMIKESSKVSDQYHHIFRQKITIRQKTKTLKTKTRAECRFGERAALFCCFSLFEARLHIYWFMIMKTRLWGLASETPPTLLARRLWAPPPLHPVRAQLILSTLWFFFFFLISSSLTQRNNHILFRHSFAFFCSSFDLLITTWHWFSRSLFTGEQNNFFLFNIFFPCRFRCHLVFRSTFSTCPRKVRRV